MLEKWNIDYSKYDIQGVSHLYALWFIALNVINKKISDKEICEKMINFYIDLRGEQKIPQTKTYQESMQSASRSKSSRKKRVNSILAYLKSEDVLIR